MISRVFYVRRYFVSSVFRNVGVFRSSNPNTPGISSTMSRHAITLGSQCRDRFGVHCHPSLGALRAVWQACMCRVLCDTFFLKKKKKKNMPMVQKSLGATLSSRTRV